MGVTGPEPKRSDIGKHRTSGVSDKRDDVKSDAFSDGPQFREIADAWLRLSVSVRELILKVVRSEVLALDPVRTK